MNNETHNGATNMTKADKNAVKNIPADKIEEVKNHADFYSFSNYKGVTVVRHWVTVMRLWADGKRHASKDHKPVEFWMNDKQHKTSKAALSDG